ncbi:MAG: hypothetical protein IJS81_01485 [Selenomonadaceae bacterium]|nr:hypothetical protein [Selenomonadaceae bacterium]
MHKIKISIKTLSPIVISAASNSTLMTGSHSEISGSIIRGILAIKYVQEKNLGNHAHEDENFIKFFYGDLKFLSATPDIKGKRSYTLPLSLQRGKKGTEGENKIVDLLKEIPPAGYKSLRGYGIVDGEKIFTASVKKNIFMHMSRSSDKERISGKSEDGQIYNYEAIDAGQTFCGAIFGEKSTLEKLVKSFEKNFVVTLGRSKFTQYGNCEFNFGKIEEIASENFGDEIYLRLESPLIPTADNFIGAKNILQTEIVDKLGGKFTLGKIFASNIEVENFVSVWGMKRPRVQALAAGTVFELTAENLTDSDKNILREKIYSGFGTRTEEGFGQLRFWKPTDFQVGEREKNKFYKPKSLSPMTIEIAQKILLERYLEQLRIYANEDAEKLRPQLSRGNYTHFFSRLDNILSSVGKKNIRENFKIQLEIEIRGGSLFDDHLKNIRMANGQKFYDVLVAGSAKLPYEERDFKTDSELIELISFDAKKYADDFCLEYLQNYFRVARKLAASAKGGAKSE